MQSSLRRCGSQFINLCLHSHLMISSFPTLNLIRDDLIDVWKGHLEKLTFI